MAQNSQEIAKTVPLKDSTSPWQQETENQDQDKERTLFIDTLVHEIKTPLSAIIASSELLLHELPAKNPLHALAENIHSSGHVLSRRVSDLANFALIQSTQFTLNLQLVDITLQVKYSAAELQHLLHHKRQKLNLELPDCLPPAKADPERVEQILLNLLTNASKFSPPDSDIDVRVYERDRYLVVEIADCAPLITPDVMDRIFTPYFRAEQTRRTPGLGLGLAICKRLVELHHGDIWVKTQQRGNVFGIALPQAPQDDSCVIGTRGESI